MPLYITLLLIGILAVLFFRWARANARVSYRQVQLDQQYIEERDQLVEMYEDGALTLEEMKVRLREVRDFYLSMYNAEENTLWLNRTVNRWKARLKQWWHSNGIW